MRTTTKILVVEDNPDIIETISLTFRLSWPEVQVLSTSFGEQGLEMVEAEAPDCVILDLGLPDISGFEVIRRVRLFSEVPILVLTVRAEEITIVKALGLGASDYVTKPFRQLELLARVKALLRRTKSAEAAPLAVGQMVFDPISFKMTLEGKEITLTRTEGLILGQLMRNPDNAVPLARLAEVVWGNDDPEAERSLKVHVRHLREKIESEPGKPRFILTRPGVGYMLASTPASDPASDPD